MTPASVANGRQRATVRDFLVIYMIGQSHGSTTFAFGRICVLCQLLHVVKERRRLADEEPHGGEECESPGGDAFRVRWPNDRNNGEASTQERTWLGHDQVLLE